MADPSKVNLAKFPPYSLPKLYGWHMLTSQAIKDDGKVYQFFGANWWDLLMNDKLPISIGGVTVQTKNTHAIIFINLGSDAVKMTNNDTGDVYNVLAGKRSNVNNTYDRTIDLVCSKPESNIHLTKIGSIWLVLLQVEQIKNGTALVKNSDIFNDFLLMTGIPDKNQYLNTVGIENFDLFRTKNWQFLDTDSGNKSRLMDLILDQWEKVNPSKRIRSPTGGIPRVIQWIWLRRDISKNEFGPLKPVFFKFMKTWIDRNPNFVFNIWSDNPNFIVPKQFEDYVTVKGPDSISKLLDRLNPKIRDDIKYLFKNHQNPGARSDTLRQAILYLEGGMYSDINDGACLAPMEAMLKKYDYIIGVEPVMYVNNAIIASKPKHPFGKAMLTWLSHNSKSFVEDWKDYFDAEQDEKDDYIVSTTGPIALTSAIFGVLEDENENEKLDYSLILPSSWIYPNYWIADSPGVWLKPVSITAHYDRRDYLATK